METVGIELRLSMFAQCTATAGAQVLQ